MPAAGRLAEWVDSMSMVARPVPAGLVDEVVTIRLVGWWVNFRGCCCLFMDEKIELSDSLVMW